MKKYIFLIATAAIVASCSKTDNFKETGELPIDFTDVQIEKSTKAPFTDVASLQASSFGVYGSKTVSGTTTKVFGQLAAEANKGVQVSYNSTTSKWAYSPLRYWDKGASAYHFYAYAPYNADNILGNVTWSESTANSFSISGFQQSHTQSDMIDILTDLTHQANVTTLQNTVDFSFSHILSNINFYMAVSPDLKADETNNPVSVNSISIGAVKMDGSYSYVSSAYTWTLASNSTTATFNAEQSNSKVFAARALKAMTNTTGNTLAAAQISEDPTEVPGLTSLLFVPQTLPTDTKYVVTIEYMIANETFNKTIDLNDFKKTVSNSDVYTSQWISGYQYNYILVIGPTPIEFGVHEIGGWADTDTYYYTIQ